jgi:hypothetical protein
MIIDGVEGNFAADPPPDPHEPYDYSSEQRQVVVFGNRVRKLKIKLNSCFPLDWCDRARALHFHEMLLKMTEGEACNFATCTSSARCATYVKHLRKK